MATKWLTYLSQRLPRLHRARAVHLDTGDLAAARSAGRGRPTADARHPRRPGRAHRGDRARGAGAGAKATGRSLAGALNIGPSTAISAGNAHGEHLVPRLPLALVAAGSSGRRASVSSAGARTREDEPADHRRAPQPRGRRERAAHDQPDQPQRGDRVLDARDRRGRCPPSARRRGLDRRLGRPGDHDPADCPPLAAAGRTCSARWWAGSPPWRSAVSACSP